MPTSLNNLLFLAYTILKNLSKEYVPLYNYSISIKKLGLIKS